MTSFLVTYGTGQGQTAKVAGYIASALADRGHDVTTRRVSNVSGGSVDEFDAVLVGSPINNRRHLPAVIEFVERNRTSLSTRPSAFFQVSMASAMPLRWAREGAMDYVDAMVDETGWRPDRIGLFAGAVTYTRYGRVERQVFRLVAMVTTGDTDTSRDYEYTDWEKVERFAVEFAEFAERRRGRPRPGSRRSGGAATGLRGRRAVELGLVLIGLAGAVFLVTERRRGRRATRKGERRQPPDRTEPITQ